MTLLNGLRDLFETLQAQVINIPTDNSLGWIYVILNGVLLLLASIFGTGGSGGINLLPF